MFTRSKRRNHAGGFTLIELLVVVAIIALLISILLPSLAKARELSRRAVCDSNMHSIVTACLVFAEGGMGSGFGGVGGFSIGKGTLPTSGAVVNPALSGANDRTATYVGGNRESPDGYTGAPPTFTVAATNQGSNMRGYWKLCMGGKRAMLQPKQWLCPSTLSLGHNFKGSSVEYNNNPAIKVYDFDGSSNTAKATVASTTAGVEPADFSYSMQVTLKNNVAPDPGAGGGKVWTANATNPLRGSVLTNTQDPRKVVGADRNPYTNTLGAYNGKTVGTVPGSGRYDYASKVKVGGFRAPPTTASDDIAAGTKAFPQAGTPSTLNNLRDKTANSRNHGQEGQNVAYLDGHAQWQKSPLCGADEDFIWGTADANATDASLPGFPWEPATGSSYGAMRSAATYTTDSLLIP